MNKMMMPEVEVVRFEAEDVIATSFLHNPYGPGYASYKNQYDIFFNPEPVATITGSTASVTVYLGTDGKPYSLDGTQKYFDEFTKYKYDYITDPYNNPTIEKADGYEFPWTLSN